MGSYIIYSNPEMTKHVGEDCLKNYEIYTQWAIPGDFLANAAENLMTCELYEIIEDMNIPYERDGNGICFIYGDNQKYTHMHAIRTEIGYITEFVSSIKKYNTYSINMLPYDKRRSIMHIAIASMNPGRYDPSPAARFRTLKESGYKNIW